MLLASGMFCFRVGTGPFSNGLLSTYYVPATVLAPEPLVVNRLHASLLTGPPDRLLGSYSPCASTFCKTWFILKELLDLLLKMEHLCPTWILKWMISVGPVVCPSACVGLIPLQTSQQSSSVYKMCSTYRTTPRLIQVPQVSMHPWSHIILSASLDITGHTGWTYDWCISENQAWLTASQHQSLSLKTSQSIAVDAHVLPSPTPRLRPETGCSQFPWRL